MNVITKTIQLPDGRTISIETGKVAKQADGSAVVRLSNTVFLAAVCVVKDVVPGTDFMPSQVDYREQHSTAGRPPGGFTKREGKPSDNEILTSRPVDRAPRSLFPSNYYAEVYVQIMLLSADGIDQPDASAGLAASVAMACLDTPFDFYISEVRVARINGEYVTNPTFEQMKQADMGLMVGATKDNIMMVEGEMKEVSEFDLISALKAVYEATKPMRAAQDELSKKLGKGAKREYDYEVNDEDLCEKMNDELYQSIYDITKQALPKQERHDVSSKVLADFSEEYDAAHAADLTEKELEGRHVEAIRYYGDVSKNVMRRCVLDEGKCLDGRRADEIRLIWCEVSPPPMPHGSAVFTRGEMQSLSICTSGTELDEKMVDDVLDKSYQRLLLHYNLPPSLTGEVKAQRGVGRREIGHGHLARRGLKGQLPDDLPYTVYLVGQILESNGSSSMTTVCAGTLALVDAGVLMERPVSGIAMDLIKSPGGDKYAVLSNTLGDEDHLDDMNSKTTDTRDGLAVTQMDIKCDGLSLETSEEALLQAKAGCEHVLSRMLETIAEPRPEMKLQVSRIETLEIPKEFIGAVIGPGGKIIQQTQEGAGATTTIDEADNVGKIQVSASNKEPTDAAITKIKSIVAIPEVGEIYEGTVRSITPYSCSVEILPGRDGLLHISEIDWKRPETVEDAGTHEGDKIRVKLLEIDLKTGKYKLFRRALLEKPEGYAECERRPRRENGGEHRPRRDDNREGRRHYEDSDRQSRCFEHRNEGSDRVHNNEPNEFNDTSDAE